jgi:ribosomal protein L11 methyltransferase
MRSGSPNKNWFAVTAHVARDVPEIIEAAEFALLELLAPGASGTEADMLGEAKNESEAKVTGYFDFPPDKTIVEARLMEALAIYGLENRALIGVSIAEIEQRDWLEEWKKGWQPIESGRFIIAPTWSEIPEDSEKIVLRIEPGMAFGTGTHETTQLCLKAISEKYVGGSFFDVGTGTAVLAMAAAKMFPAARIEACDTDEDSVVIAKENAALNSVAKNIDFYAGTITESAPEFDFVCANLTADVILPLLPLLVAKSRGWLVLSGILAGQQTEISFALRSLNQQMFKVEQMGEWVSFTIERNG